MIEQELSTFYHQSFKVSDRTQLRRQRSSGWSYIGFWLSTILSGQYPSLCTASSSRVLGLLHHLTQSNVYGSSGSLLHRKSISSDHQSIRTCFLRPPSSYWPLANYPPPHDYTQRYSHFLIPFTVDLDRRPFLPFDSYPIRRSRYNNFNLSLL